MSEINDISNKNIKINYNYGVNKVHDLDKFEQLRMKDYIGRICSSYNYLNAMECNNDYRNASDILENLSNVFREEYSDKLFNIAKGNHPCCRDILYVGALYHTFVGNDKEAVKYYDELANQYKLIGNEKNYEKYKNIAKKIKDETL